MIKVAWDRVTRDHVSRAIGEYDRLGPESSFSAWFRPDHDLRSDLEQTPLPAESDSRHGP